MPYPSVEVNGVELPEEVASEWGLVPQIAYDQLAEPMEPMTPSPAITDWGQVAEDPNSNPQDLISPPQPAAPAMPTPAELQAQLPTAPGTSGSLRVSQSRPSGRPDLVQAPPEGADPMDLMQPHAQAASIRTQGILRQAEGEAGVLGTEADMAEATGQEALEHATDMAVKNAFLQQHNKEREQRVLAEMAKVKSVDPSRVWTQASTFKKAVGLGAAFLGGFMEPVTGKNTALATIMQIIDQDIRAQETDIATQRENVYRMERAIGREQDAEESDIERFEKNRLLRLDALQSQYMKDMAQYKSQITRGKYQEMIGVVADKAAETWDNLNQIWAAHGLQRYNAFYNARQGEMQARASMTSAAASMQNARTNAEELKLKKRQADAEAEGLAYVRNPDSGERIIVDTKVQGAKHLIDNLWDKDKGLAGYATMTKDLKELAKMQAELRHAYGGPGSDMFERMVKDPRYKAMEQKYQDVVSEERHRLYGAALTEVEAKNFAAKIPKPSTILKLDSTPYYLSTLKSKATEAQAKFGNVLDMRREDGSKVDFVKDWGALDLGTQELSRNTGTPVEKIFGARRALQTNPGLVGDDTVKDSITEIQARAKDLKRGQDVDNDAVDFELLQQGEMLAQDLESAGQVRNAFKVRDALVDLNKVITKSRTPERPSSFGPSGNYFPAPPVQTPTKRVKETIEPRTKRTKAEQDKVNVPNLRKYEP